MMMMIFKMMMMVIFIMMMILIMIMIALYTIIIHHSHYDHIIQSDVDSSCIVHASAIYNSVLFGVGQSDSMSRI